VCVRNSKKAEGEEEEEEEEEAKKKIEKKISIALPSAFPRRRPQNAQVHLAPIEPSSRLSFLSFFSFPFPSPTHSSDRITTSTH
jgi:hypothetical protein